MNEIETITIRPRPAIRTLGILVVVLSVLPSVGSVFIAIIYPQFFEAAPLVFAIPVLLAIVGIFFGYRWLNVGGILNEEDVRLNGIFFSKRIPRGDVGKVVATSSFSKRENHDVIKHGFMVADRRGEKIAAVPDSLKSCEEYKEFIDRLKKLAELNSEND